MAHVRCFSKSRFLRRTLRLVAIVLAIPVATHAQSLHRAQSSSPPGNAASNGDFRFELFSIKRNKSYDVYSNPNEAPGERGLLQDGYRDPGANLWDLIMFAYDPLPVMYWPQVKMQNLPDWANTEFYSVEARVANQDIAAWKAQDNAHYELLSAALRSTLKERCKLELHEIPSEATYYSLVAGKHGIKLKAAAPEAPAQTDGMPLLYGGRMTISVKEGVQTRTFHAATMQSLASILSLNHQRVPVQDKTGLQGKYDFSIRQTESEEDASSPQRTEWSIHDLGLELKPDKGPSFTLVIDHIERPDPN